MLATSSTAEPTHPLVPTEYDDSTRSALTQELFERLKTCRGKQARAALVEEITTINLQVADALAQRYAARGLPLDDLVQEARLALVRVVESFKPDLGHDFLSYAVPSILGSLRKQFRDTGWSVRPPRRVQEAQQAINRVRPDLLQDLGREPTVAELAARTGLDEETTVEALSADGCYAPTSLDAPVVASAEAGDPRVRSLGATLGCDDAEMARSEIRVALRPLLRRLPARDREVLRLRFVEGLTQREVGEAIGVTQMQVSRILARIFATLRTELGDVPARELAA
ncbi:MAG: sigma-70 family RNA polymerase sigma factor [Nocardioidaceae bacterium]|nr:sigma-70 family RNA polymerase sigma factor [Nocardioidaceae bacterium]